MQRKMLGLLKAELHAAQIGKLRKVLHYNGLPIDARSVTTDILAQEGVVSVAHPDGNRGALGGE